MLAKVVGPRPQLALASTRPFATDVHIPIAFKLLVDRLLVSRQIVLGAEAFAAPGASRMRAMVGLAMPLHVLAASQ
jgi:hypothetical protein